MGHEEQRSETSRKTPLSSSSSSSSCNNNYSLEEELKHMPLGKPPWKSKKCLSKQLSMCETPRDIAWEKRRRQILLQERRRNHVNVGLFVEEQKREENNNNNSNSNNGGSSNNNNNTNIITDEDMHELKGSIELGFGFNEEDGQRLCPTLPALDLYFAVNRQVSPSPVSTPQSRASFSSNCFESPKSDSESWKICSPGEDPQMVKTKLRHWAQAVACSVMQSY